MAGMERSLAELRGLLTGKQNSPAPAAQPDIEAIARAEIERGKQKQAEEDAAAQAEGRIAKVEKDLAKLRETKPKEPVKRLFKVLWPGHDRD